MVDQGRLGRLRDQLFQDRLGLLSKRVHQFPLSPSWQRHPQALLELAQTAVRHPAAITQQGHRRPDAYFSVPAFGGVGAVNTSPQVSQQTRQIGLPITTRTHQEKPLLSTPSCKK